jgi:hypothetical protein
MAHNWQPNEVFVFGSNLLGIHGAGAAKFAADNCGAIRGLGEGLAGMSYALPTCIAPGKPATLERIKLSADEFIRFAQKHPEMTFFLTSVGTGIAGFTHEQIAPMFKNVPSNVRVPPEWIDLIR